MKTKLLLGLSLLSIPFMGYANGYVQFNLVNISPSLAFPRVEVQQGSFNYYYMSYSGAQPPVGCPTYDNPAYAPLSVPFDVSKVKSTVFTFTPPDLDVCMSGQEGSNFIAIVGLLITEVNEMDAPHCGAANNLQSPTDVEQATLGIARTANSVNCVSS